MESAALISYTSHRDFDNCERPGVNSAHSAVGYAAVSVERATAMVEVEPGFLHLRRKY